MNVLFVMESFCLGGVEKVTLNLIKAIHAQSEGSIVCSVAVQQDGGDLAKAFHALCAVYVMTAADKCQPLLPVIKNFMPEVVVFTKGGLSRLANHEIRILVKRIFAVQHVPINLPENNVFKNLIRVLGASWLYRRLDKVVCVSTGIQNNLKRLLALDEAKLKMIHNPVISDEILQSAAEAACEYDNYFICVGRLHYQKGYDRLITIAIEARKSIPDLKIIIFGDGPDKDMLQKSINAHGLKTTIILHGNVANPYKYMARAKALLLTSRWEGLPTVLVEASALNLPIISFDCRYGPAEVTVKGKHGYLIPSNDDMSFARAIVAVAQGRPPSIPDVSSYCYAEAARQYINLFING